MGAFEYDAQTISERRGVPTLPLDEEQVETIVYHNSPPTRFGDTYREEFADQQEITVYLHAALTELELNETNTAVTSVTARSTNALLNIAATRFCFAMGGIENARHLMILAQQKGLRLMEKVIDWDNSQSIPIMDLVMPCFEDGTTTACTE